jgi:hypothetical protein
MPHRERHFNIADVYPVQGRDHPAAAQGGNPLVIITRVRFPSPAQLSINDLQTSASKAQVKRGYFAEFLKKKRATILVLRVELPVNSKNESPQKTILSVQKISTNHTEIRPRETECSQPACRRPGFVIFVGSFQFGNLRLFFIQKMKLLAIILVCGCCFKKIPDRVPGQSCFRWRENILADQASF